MPAAPSQVDVYFKQDVFKQAGANYVRVFSDAGSQVTDDGTVDDSDRTHISVALPRGLAQGRYTVHWKTTSDEDGEEDSGAFCFYVGVQPTAAQQAECASFVPTPVPTIADATAQASPATMQSVSPTPAPTTRSTSSGGSSSTGVVLGVVGAIVAVVVLGGAGLWWRSRRA